MLSGTVIQDRPLSKVTPLRVSCVLFDVHNAFADYFMAVRCVDIRVSLLLP